MFEFLFICGFIGLVFVIIKHLSNKWAYKRKIARYQAEIDARPGAVKSEPASESYYETATNEWRTNQSPKESGSPPTRKHAKPEIDEFLNVKRKTKVIVFDVETNGLSREHSVLSCSAIKYEYNPNAHEMNELDRFERFYYPLERFNPSATAVNGLTRDVIDKKRGDATYFRNFNDDPAFEDFCKGVNRFIAHNISFDCKFVPLSGKRKFCTMMANTDIVCTEWLPYKREWKWPKLSETASYYEIPFNEDELHGSMTDAELTAKIFAKMLQEARQAEGADSVQ